MPFSPERNLKRETESRTPLEGLTEISKGKIVKLSELELEHLKVFDIGDKIRCCPVFESAGDWWAWMEFDDVRRFGQG